MSQDEYNTFVVFEKEGQVWLDTFYKTKGYTPDRTSASWHYDVVLNNQKHLFKVEEKIRDRVRNDCLIELLQDVTPPFSGGKLGWLYVIQADYIIYAMKNNQDFVVYKINVKRLKEKFSGILDESIDFRVSKKGRGITLNLVVGWGVLEEKGIAKAWL